MKKQLKKYRKSNAFTKKEMADKLGIPLEEYRAIESGDNQLDNTIKKRIKDLLGEKVVKPPKNMSSWLSTYDKLPSGIKPFTALNNKMSKLQVGISNPTLKAMSNIGIPKSPVQDITKAMRAVHTVFDRPMLADVLSSAVVSKPSNWVDLVAGRNRSLDWVNPLVNTQFTIKSSLGNLLENEAYKTKAGVNHFWKDIRDITDTTKAITDAVVGNQQLYNEYIDFSSELSKSIAGFSEIGNYYPKDNFLKGAEFLTAFDVVSGTIFADQLDSLENDDQTEEIIGNVKDDNAFKEQNQSFLNDFTEIIESEGIEISEEVLMPLYKRIHIWVGNYFSVSELLQFKITRRLVYQMVMLAIAIIAMKNASVIISNQLNLIDLQSKELKMDERQKEMLTKIIENQDIEGVEIIQAKGNVNLRKRPNAQSKILAVVPTKQNVTILKRNRLWVLVGYEEIATKNPRSGWVKLEFFDNVE